MATSEVKPKGQTQHELCDVDHEPRASASSSTGPSTSLVSV
ncbi:MAG: hypothetical protein AAF639_13605 [Chloroflexota bacterium]